MNWESSKKKERKRKEKNPVYALPSETHKNQQKCFIHTERAYCPTGDFPRGFKGAYHDPRSVSQFRIIKVLLYKSRGVIVLYVTFFFITDLLLYFYNVDLVSLSSEKKKKKFIIGKKASNECYKRIGLRLNVPLWECVSNEKEQDCNTAREHNRPCHFAIGLSTWHGIWSWCGHNQKLSKDERKIAAYIFITRANSKTDIADNEIYISSGPYPVPLYCMVFLVLRIYEGHGSLISCITFSVSWRCVRKAYYSKDFVGNKWKVVSWSTFQSLSLLLMSDNI